MTKWLSVAKKYIGVKEIPGNANNPLILQWWLAIKTSFNQDSVPWCAAFVGGVLEESGIRSSRSAMARSYAKWGVPLSTPTEGCVVVLWRGNPASASGHVGFVVGRDQRGNLMVLGGNQADAVNIKPFPESRVVSYRWPKEAFVPAIKSMPIVNSDGKLSQNEA
jgi:uncharacterized protein (TIGR02594 family)